MIFVGSAKVRLERTLEIAGIVAALATIPVTIAYEHGIDDPLVSVVDWSIWAVFLIEYVVLVTLARDRWLYTRRNWLNVLVTIVSFPLLPHSMELARLARLMRLFRLVVVGWWGFKELEIVLGRRGTSHVVLGSIFLVLTGGGLLAAVEPDTVKGDFWTGVWWAMVTVTTVGYGDIYPTTVWGRLAAVALMLIGIGLTSTIAASIAAHFIGHREGADLASLAERLDRIERTLQTLTETRADPAEQEQPAQPHEVQSGRR